LGTTMICVVSVLAVMLLCGVPIRALLVVLLGIGILGVAAIALSSYRSSRLNFMDPWADPANTGYQLVHSFLALASGGIFGVGLGNSFEKKLYLPEAETDFIFAIIGEEGGLIATLFVVLCFCVFLYGGFRIALNSHDKMGVYLAGALTTMLVFQAFLNIMCAIGLAPTTGKPLPFISSGGSSLISSLIVVGLILSVSYNNSSNSPARRRDELRILTAEPPAPARAYRSQQRSTSRGSSGGSNAYGGFKPASNARGYEDDAYVNRNRGYSDGYSDGRSPRNTRSSRAGRGGSSRNSRR